MRALLFLTPVLAAAALALAPAATADQDSNLPSCTSVGGTEMGGAATECATPGNVQLNASPPEEPTYLYPWNDEFYGPALIIGGDGGGGFHGGGGGHR